MIALIHFEKNHGSTTEIVLEARNSRHGDMRRLEHESKILNSKQLKQNNGATEGTRSVC